MSKRFKITILVILILLLLIAAVVLVWYFHRQHRQQRESIPVVVASATQAAIVVVRPNIAPGTKRSNPAKFLPKARERQIQILEQPFFVIGYDNQRKNPAWVVYDLDGPIVNTGRSPQRPRFVPDPRTSAHVLDSDYINSGYDRGHMVPAYAQWSRHGVLGFEKTFVLSNIVPQKHGMNAGIWEDLEDNISGKCRGNCVEDEGYAGKFRNVTVINGPVYEGQAEKLRNGTLIPSSCFSVVLDFQEDTGKYRSMAFEIPNKTEVPGPLIHWSTTIKKIEEKTGLDFFEGNEDIRVEVEEKQTFHVW